MLAAAVLAERKNRNRSSWMAWCFVLPPLALVLAFLPRAEAAPKTKRASEDDDDEDGIDEVLDGGN
jgi:hypothetical protein